MQKAYSVLFLLLWEAVCLKQRLGVDHHASIVPNQCTVPELFSTFHYLPSSLAYLLSSLFFFFSSFFSDSQHGIQSRPSCVIVCHVSTCCLSSFFIHFCSQLVRLETRFFACLNSACSLSIHWLFCIHSHALHVT